MMRPMILHHQRTELLLLFAFACVALLLASCAVVPPAPSSTPPPATATPKPTATATPSATPTVPPDWQSRWLQKIPCAAPCVEGITPGKTTVSEAIELLKQSPLVSNVKNKSNFDAAHKIGAIFWDWVNWRTGGAALYQSDNSASILSITPEFGISYSVRDVMQTYGEPTFVLATAGYRVSEMPIYFQEVTLVWLPNGFRLYGSSSRFQLDENTQFSMLLFFAPTREAFEAGSSTAQLHPDWLLPWEGFKGFQYYCRDGVNGKLCRGEQPPP